MKTTEELEKEVAQLRAEAAKWRTQSSKYREAFSGYEDREVDYLLTNIQGAAGDPTQAGQFFKDMGARMLNEDTSAPAETDEEDEVSENNLTLADIEKLLKQQREEDTAAAQQAEAQAAAEEVFSEMEAAGLVRGTPEFGFALNYAEFLVANDQDPDFAKIADNMPQIKSMFEIGEPSAEENNEEGVGEGEGETQEATSSEDGEAPSEPAGDKFPLTTDAGGNGQAKPTTEDWIAKAEEAGTDPFEAARERMEARFDG